MTKRIIDRIADLVNNARLSLADAIEIVVPGADVELWRKRLNSYDPNPPKPKRKRSRRAGGGGKRKRSAAYALTVKTILATAELVGRVNKGDGDEAN